MGLESIVSQIPVVGTILGPLLGMLFKSGNTEGGRYTLRLGPGPNQLADFSLDKDHHIVFTNRSKNPVAMTFPAQNSYSGETIVVPPISQMDAAKPLINCTANDIDTFEITTSLEETNTAADGTGPVSISSSGSVPTNGNDKNLGSYIIVKIERLYNPSTKETDNWITVTMDEGSTLQQVTHLFVKSSEGSQEFRISNCKAENDEVRVLLPPLVVKGADVLVNVTVESVSSYKHPRMVELGKKYNIRPLTPEDIRRIEAMPNLNQ